MMRLLAVAIAGVLLWGFLPGEAVAATVYWTGGAPGGHGDWKDPRNWSSYPNLPGFDDDVIIDTNETVIFRSGVTRLGSIQCENNLTVGYALPVGAGGGYVHGTLLIKGGLIVMDGGTFAASGPTDVENAFAGLRAEGGGRLALPNLTTWTITREDWKFIVSAEGKADGTGALVDLPGLEAITTEVPAEFGVYALDGGTANLGALTTFEGDRLWVESKGSGSMVDMSRLADAHPHIEIEAEGGGVVGLGSVTGFEGELLKVVADGVGSSVDLSALATVTLVAQDSECDFTVRNGGQILLSDALLELDDANLTIGLGHLTTAHFTHLRGCNVAIEQGAAVSFDALNLIRYGDVSVGPGCTLAAPALTTWASNLTATGAGTRVELPSLTKLQRTIVAQEGAFIDLSALRSNGGGGQWVHAIGSGSVVDLSGVTDWSHATLQVEDGGEIILSSTASELEYVHLVIDAGTISTEQFTHISGGDLTVSHATPSFPNVGYVYDCDLSALDGGTLSLPALTELTLPAWTPVELSATGVDGSGNPARLDLSNLTSIPGMYWDLKVRAENGGVVDLNSLGSTGGAYLRVTAHGQGSVVDLSRLTTFCDGPPPLMHTLTANAEEGGIVVLSALRSNDGEAIPCVARGAGSVVDLSGLTSYYDGGEIGYARWTAEDGGHIVLGEALHELARVDLEFRGAGTITTDQVTHFADGSITVSDNGSHSFANLTSLQNADLSAGTLEGSGWKWTAIPGILAMPKLRTASLAWRSGEPFPEPYRWEAHADGGLLDLSSLTTLTGNDWELRVVAAPGTKVGLSSLRAIEGSGWTLDVGSDEHSTIDLSSLSSSDGGAMSVDADGEGSLVDLSGMTRFTGRLEVSREAVVLLHESAEVEMVGAQIEVALGRIAAGTLRLGSNTRLDGYGRVDANVTNTAGVVSSSSTLEICGDYVQESFGELVVDVASAHLFDQFKVTGNARLGGTLTLNIEETVDLWPETEIPILAVGGSCRGTFDGLDPYAPVWADEDGDQLCITYRDGAGGSSVVLVTRAFVDPARLRPTSGTTW